MKSEISALLDGELAPEAAGRAIETLRRQGDLRREWEIYHLIGDAMRRAPALSPYFSDRVMECLAREPTVLAPPGTQAKRSVLRFALPLAASVMGVGAVAWVALSLNPPQPIRVAAAPPPVQQAAQPAAPKLAAAQISQEALKGYLVAHEAHSPGSRIQGVAPYVRTVSEIRQDNGR